MKRGNRNNSYERGGQVALAKAMGNVAKKGDKEINDGREEIKSIRKDITSSENQINNLNSKEKEIEKVILDKKNEINEIKDDLGDIYKTVQDAKKQKSKFAEGGEAISREDIVEVLKDELEDVLEDANQEYEGQDIEGEEVEYKSRDGFIPFTDGGYEYRFFVYGNYLTGSGKSLPTNTLDGELERQQELNLEYGKERFAEEYPELVKELGEENIDYGFLSDKGYQDEAEELDEMSMPDDDSIMFEVEAFYYNPDNDRGIDGKHTIVLTGSVNMEAPYHRTGNYEDYTQDKFTFDSIEDLKEKLQKGIDKISKWFDGDNYKEGRELKMGRFAKGGKVKTSDGRFLWFFNWNDGGFNQVYAKTKAQAIKKATEDGYPSYMPDNQYARERSLQDVKEKYGKKAVDYIINEVSTNGNWSNNDQKRYYPKLTLKSVGFSSGLTPNKSTFRKQSAEDSRRTDEMANRMTMEKGGFITFSDGYKFQEVSKSFAEKNWDKMEIYGINISEESEGLIDSKNDIEDYDNFGIEHEDYAKGGKIMKTYDDFDRDYDEFTDYVMDKIDLDERRNIRDDWNKKSRENREKGIKGGKEMRWENYLLKRVNEKSYAKGGEVKKKENNEMLIGGIAGILIGIFLGRR
tara:strand:- start:8307 stop:10202 length:1896 start_codon:yes stop_codon:yes gene_type:complete